MGFITFALVEAVGSMKRIWMPMVFSDRSLIGQWGRVHDTLIFEILDLLGVMCVMV